MDVIENEKDALCALQNVLFAITKRKTFLAIVSLYWIEEYFLVVGDEHEDMEITSVRIWELWFNFIVTMMAILFRPGFMVQLNLKV